MIMQYSRKLAVPKFLATSCHMRSHVLCTSLIEFSVEMGFVVLASFIARARGIKFYDVDPRTLVPGLAVTLRRKCNRFDANVATNCRYH